MTITEFLKDGVPFLAGITEDQASYLARAAEQKPVPSGHTVIFQGATIDGLYVIAAGKVSVYVRSVKKRELVKVAELGPGEVFGETSVVEFTTAGATIKSASADTLVFLIPELDFRKILDTDPELKSRTLALIEERRKSQPKLKN